MTFTKLVWSTRAAIEYEKLVSYLSEEWGEKKPYEHPEILIGTLIEYLIILNSSLF